MIFELFSFEELFGSPFNYLVEATYTGDENVAELFCLLTAELLISIRNTPTLVIYLQ
jgi:hypothetical protein